MLLLSLISEVSFVMFPFSSYLPSSTPKFHRHISRLVWRHRTLVTSSEGSSLFTEIKLLRRPYRIKFPLLFTGHARIRDFRWVQNESSACLVPCLKPLIVHLNNNKKEYKNNSRIVLLYCTQFISHTNNKMKDNLQRTEQNFHS